MSIVPAMQLMVKVNVKKVEHHLHDISLTVLASPDYGVSPLPAREQVPPSFLIYNLRARQLMLKPQVPPRSLRSQPPVGASACICVLIVPIALTGHGCLAYLRVQADGPVKVGSSLYPALLLFSRRFIPVRGTTPSQ